MDELQQIAEEIIRAEGYDYPVTILLGEEEYPEKNYDSVCFPSGKYTSLRVCIGDAEGQNWWCCLFPPLCLGNSTVSSEDAEDAFISVGLTPDQYKIITRTEKPVYRVRFKILELLQDLW
jgi:stage II sporulation protein R